ncbi:LOW QUALITY PROTEIN: hypothetical protein CIRG_03391 [Coccidioides immitis RMSCC 2394]|uniref:Altered inheritance of mitochondria protein 9, mitochondrial n=1 Tax=Coccidioides immitis RMSCC 2394 TaxID=404692 RepID=A0A0J6Y9J2_COCIT|nr:LOW QUALITY PROTEIN: hypothetical protein CIRG_03391 [Coccidioides immitis RMSCC 2394]
MTKLVEGTFNKTFHLKMDNSSTAIARIPQPIAGPKYYTTASEITIIDFTHLLVLSKLFYIWFTLLQAHTVLQIPALQVHTWSACADNPVGAEYIIMEEATGTKLEDIWDNLSLEDRIGIMKDLVLIENKLLSVSFSRYGNLYYSGKAVPGAVVAEVVSDTSPELKMDMKTQFSIGPVVARDFWTKENSVMDIDQGHLPHEYAAALVHCEQKWIEQYTIPKPATDQFITSTVQNSSEAHLSLLKKYLQVAPYLLPTDDPNLITSTIWHTDLHASNLFVDKGHITSVIDWQEAWTGPLVLQGHHPHLVDYQGDIILEPPPNFKDLELNEKAQLKKQIASSIILYLYEQQTAKLNPNLNRVLHLKLGRVRCEPISFVSNTWDDDILPLHELLINVERMSSRDTQRMEKDGTKCKTFEEL